MKKVIPIVYCTNDKYVNLCSVSIESIIANSSNNYTYNIYIFFTRLSKLNIKYLTDMSDGNIQVKCINIKKYITNLDDLYETQYFSYEMYFRYFPPLILNQYEKIIYLDCDVILISDISKLYNENINKYVMGIVLDYADFLRKNMDYFNSGVILFNTKRFEQEKIREKCFELLKVKKFDYPDQDALNYVCKDKVKYLNPLYNYIPGIVTMVNFPKLIKNTIYENLSTSKPIIVHFTYITKPTCSICSIYCNDFWKYAKMTKRYDQISSEFLENSYEGLLKSTNENTIIRLTKEGKIGMKGILRIFFSQVYYWFKYKINK